MSDQLPTRSADDADDPLDQASQLRRCVPIDFSCPHKRKCMLHAALAGAIAAATLWAAGKLPGCQSKLDVPGASWTVKWFPPGASGTDTTSTVTQTSSTTKP